MWDLALNQNLLFLKVQSPKMSLQHHHPDILSFKLSQVPMPVHLSVDHQQLGMRTATHQWQSSTGGNSCYQPHSGPWWVWLAGAARTSCRWFVGCLCDISDVSLSSVDFTGSKTFTIVGPRSLVRPPRLIPLLPSSFNPQGRRRSSICGEVE